MQSRTQSVAHIGGLPVLVVTDGNFQQVRTMRRLFEGNGYLPVVATNRYDALNLARGFDPAVIVIDTIAPGIETMETARQFRADEALAFTPMLLLVNEPSKAPHAVHLGLDGTALEVLRKPVEPEKLVEVMRRLASENAVTLVQERRSQTTLMGL